MLGYKVDWATGGEAADNTKAPNPPNVYGATKAWGEALCRKFSNADGLSCIALRFTSPRAHSATIIARNVARCVDAGPEARHRPPSPPPPPPPAHHCHRVRRRTPAQAWTRAWAGGVRPAELGRARGPGLRQALRSALSRGC